MSKTPIKVYFNPVDKKLLDENGQVITNDAQIPRTRLTEQGVINIQLVTGYDTATEAFMKYQELASGITARALVDNDFSNPEIDRTFVTGSGHWTVSALGTNEYYYVPATNSEPVYVYENTVAMTAGTIGALTAGQMAYGDNDSIGSNRVYVRLTDNTDPDAKTLGYMTYRLASDTYTPVFLDSEEFNNALTWYEESTKTWRNPNITDGELTLEYNANTDSYYDRINADVNATSKGFARTTMQLPLYASGTGEHFDTYEFNFFSYNRYLPDDQIKLDVAVLTVYTKTEVDAIAGGKMDKHSPTITPGNVAIFAADGVNVEDGGALPTGGGDVTGPGSSTDNAFPRFDGATGKVIQGGKTTETDVGDVTVNGDLSADAAAFDSVDVGDEAYGAGWNADTTTPTKNAVYDEMEKKLAANVSGLAVKSTLDGTELIFIRDGGVSKQSTTQKIVDKAIADFPDVELENGVETPASEIDDDDDNKPVTAQRDKDTAPVSVIVLNHMDGVAGGLAWADDSTFAHAASYQGNPTLSTTQKVAEGFGTCVELDGNDGWDYPVTNFDPAATDFGFAAKCYIADVNKNAHMPLLHVATGLTTDQVLYVYFEGGYLKYKIGTDTGSGEFTDMDSVEVVAAGFMNVDGWNSVVFQRNAAELQVGLNGYVLMRLSMTGKTLNTPNVASRIRFGYDIDAASSPDNFFTGFIDEVVLISGDKFMTIATGGVTPVSYEDWAIERHVTKVYDIGSASISLSCSASFTNADLTAGVLSVNHGLGNKYVVVSVYDNSDELVFADSVALVDADNLTVDLSTYGTLTGTWRVVANG